MFQHRSMMSLLFLPLCAGLLAACGNSTATDPDAGLAPDEVALTPEQLLGKRLFEDATLSEPAGQSCASCHDADQAFAGNNGSRIAAVALGSRAETFGNRNVPTAMYASFSPPFSFVAETDDDGAVEYTPTGGQFWDGRAADLAEQARGPFLNPREMNNADRETVVAKVRDGAYADLFRAVYGDDALEDVDMAYQQLSEAIAAFEGTERFHPFASKFDRYLRGEVELSAIEQHGLELFQDPEKGNCISCHVGDPDSHDPADWLFTDFTYDSLGLPRNADIPDNADPTYADLGLCDQEGIASRAPAGFDVESLCGAFKVPTLRNVARTAPYGHNGYFAELRDVVRFYVTRDTNAELWYPTDDSGAVQKFDDLPAELHDNVNTDEVPYDRHVGEEPRLDDDEIDAVVAFLNTLSDS